MNRANIRIETDGLILRDHVIEDLESYHDIFSDVQLMYFPWDWKTYSLEDSEARLRATIAEIEKPEREYYYLYVEEKSSGAHIGEAGLTLLAKTPAGDMAELAVIVKKQYWGNGYAAEITEALFAYAFEELSVFRIMGTCIKENTAAERVMQKCAMVKEAEFLKSEWHDGALMSRVVYRILKDEWILKRRTRNTGVALPFTLEKWDLKYVGDIPKHINNRRITDNLREGLPYPYTKKDAEAYIKIRMDADEDKELCRAIVLDGEAIGTISIYMEEGVNRKNAEIGYWLSEEYWGSGIMSAAIRRLSMEVFRDFDIIRIYAEVFEYNIGSQKALTKAGFSREAVLKRRIVKNDMIYDVFIYSLLK